MFKFAEKLYFLRTNDCCKKYMGFIYNSWGKFMNFSCLDEVPKQWVNLEDWQWLCFISKAMTYDKLSDYILAILNAF